MTKLVLWFIMNYGLTNIMVFGSIFSQLREFFYSWGQNKLAPFNGLGKFISGIFACTMCFSTWGGFFFGLFIFSPTNFYLQTPIEISWFFDGLLASGAVWAINAIIEWFENNRK
jgi:hypothetical protein